MDLLKIALAVTEILEHLSELGYQILYEKHREEKQKHHSEQ